MTWWTVREVKIRNACCSYKSRSLNSNSQTLILRMETLLCKRISSRCSYNFSRAKLTQILTSREIQIRAAWVWLISKMHRRKSASCSQNLNRSRNNAIRNCSFSKLGLREKVQIRRQKWLDILKYWITSRLKIFYAKRLTTFSWWHRCWIRSCLKVTRRTVRCKSWPSWQMNKTSYLLTS